MFYSYMVLIYLYLPDFYFTSMFRAGSVSCGPRAPGLPARLRHHHHRPAGEAEKLCRHETGAGHPRHAGGQLSVQRITQHCILHELSFLRRNKQKRIWQDFQSNQCSLSYILFMGPNCSSNKGIGTKRSNCCNVDNVLR